ncbi:MAG: hypothetical protein GF308_11575 [Candidatus Heimdallarchaeota archaeon]|nr:hypothetical protein [Candidatus Heimdallarchaeota archaeon]
MTVWDIIISAIAAMTFKQFLITIVIIFSLLAFIGILIKNRIERDWGKNLILYGIGLILGLIFKHFWATFLTNNWAMFPNFAPWFQEGIAYVVSIISKSLLVGSADFMFFRKWQK